MKCQYSTRETLQIQPDYNILVFSGGLLAVGTKLIEIYTGVRKNSTIECGSGHYYNKYNYIIVSNIITYIAYNSCIGN